MGMDLSRFDLWYRIRYRRTSSAFIATAMILADLFGGMLSIGTGFFWVNLYDMSIINFKSFVTYWPYLPFFIILFWMFRLYPGVSLAPAEELRHFTTASLITHGGIILSRYIEATKFDAISAAFIVSFVFSPVILMVCRSLGHSILRRSPVKGIPAVIFGSGPLGRLVVEQLLGSKRMGYVPVLILDHAPEPVAGDEDSYRGIPIIYDLSLGPELVRRYNIKMAIIAMPELSDDELARLLNYSVADFRYNVLIPDFVSVANIWMSIRDFEGLLGLATTHRLRMGWNLAMKRALDLFVVILGGLIVMPFLLVIALLIKLSSPGPVLYKHFRVGQNGKALGVYKFRSMVINADARLRDMLESDGELRKEWEANYKLKKDPRITWIGRWMRGTSIDEFPQIFNVLKGEMSLVGPRPVTEAEVERYGENFQRIFSVKPGMTGLWQVSGRSDTDYNDRVSYDSYYLQSWSIWLDLWVLYKTVGVVFRGKGAY